MRNVLFAIGVGCQCFYVGCRYGVKLEKDIVELIYFLGLMLTITYFALY